MSLSDLHLHKMKQDRYPFFDHVVKLLDNPRRLLITIVTSNEAVNISISILAASFFIGLLGASGQWVSIAFTTVVLLIVGEAIPKTFGVTYPMQVSTIVSPLLTAVSRLEYPVVAGLEKISGIFLRRFDSRHSADVEALMEDEFKTLIDACSPESGLDGSQKDLIRKIFELGDQPVTDIMIPRVDMFCLPLAMPVNDMLTAIAQARQERVPIYTEDRDDIIGVLFARDLLNDVWRGRRPDSIRKLLVRPFFVPEEKTITGLLRDFQESFSQIAIVVDEYGGVSGMVTLEHILEYLFEEPPGDDAACDGCEHIDADTVAVPGNMTLEQVNALIESSLPEDDFDTVGGFVVHLFGKLPEKGEVVRSEGFIFTVLAVGRNRIEKLLIKKEADAGEEDSTP